MTAVKKYNPGDTAYIIESGLYVREVVILRAAGGMYTVRFSDYGGGMKVRESRLFPSSEEAEKSLKRTSK